MEQLRLTVSRQSVQNNGIADKADLERFRAELQKTEKRVISVKEHLRKCQQTHTVYADIAKTYREISQGDYISKLVTEERKRQDTERILRKENQSI
jgi:predicted anti-sigma-YlaC factor YlaD